MTGALTGSFLGRVTNVRSLSQRVLLTQSYRTSAFSKRSLGCDCCADVEERRDKIAKRKTAVILVSTSYLRTPGAFGEPNVHSDAWHPEAGAISMAFDRERFGGGFGGGTRHFRF